MLAQSSATLQPRVIERNRILIVTCSDNRFMGFLRDMLGSLARFPQSRDFDIACLDLGLSDTDKKWLAPRVKYLTVPEPEIGARDNNPPSARAFLTRPFLRDMYPGYDVYIWIDSDIWLQYWSVIEDYISGALQHGLAVTHERERAYKFEAWLFGWFAKHIILGNGLLAGPYLIMQPQLNAGLFAMHRDAPHWDSWAWHYKDAYRRTRAATPHDQFSLYRAVYGSPFSKGLKTSVLSPGHNWICDRGVPMWNDDEQAFCEPYPPYRPIGAIHLAGPAKHREYLIQRTRGGSFKTKLLFGASPERNFTIPAPSSRLVA